MNTHTRSFEVSRLTSSAHDSMYFISMTPHHKGTQYRTCNLLNQNTSPIVCYIVGEMQNDPIFLTTPTRHAVLFPGRGEDKVQWWGRTSPEIQVGQVQWEGGTSPVMRWDKSSHEVGHVGQVQWWGGTSPETDETSPVMRWDNSDEVAQVQWGGGTSPETQVGQVQWGGGTNPVTRWDKSSDNMG